MGCSSAAAHMRTARRSAMRAAHIWSAVRMHGAQLSRSTYAHCAPRRSALPCGQNESCRRHMLCPLCAQHSMLHALRPMRVALHICAPIYLVCCAACMRHGTLCCMPLQVRSAALRRIHAAHNIKVYRKACMERSAHGVQLSRSAHAHFSSLLNFEAPKSPENRRTITIYVKSTVFFFRFWDKGLEMAG